ncbi:zinc metallopeptidase [Deinococcus cellulosilyticus]|uniref:Zn-dependent protease n=1 Tax=Deinococcus cellulosilyticus (strain DSM 18568 / NBRC 106333 / KACC 11606 / 5516J-15) TaxID=1223518 RepID=A0A511N9K7_DEIC1|nr:zinc metallopeptidase [Deinococcus cellulosilyticus]GEM49519.1 Zn-dependent protease [Deinococcus cellulosilyticus NBRC 106333 = KACC 11606]
MLFTPFTLLIILLIVGSFLIQGYLMRTYRTYSQHRNTRGLTGAQVARHLLDEAGLHNVPVEVAPGFLSDHYDPRQKVVRLSEHNFSQPSLAAAAIAAHEVGHAQQDASRNPALVLRSQLAPALMFGSNFGPLLVILGFMFKLSGLTLLGVILFAAAVAFHLITLPVEFDASGRALRQLEQKGLLSLQENSGARKVLTAAALTYIAGFAIALAQLLEYVYLFTGSRND